MEEAQTKALSFKMLDLIGVALNKKETSEVVLSADDMKELFYTARKHNLCAMTAYALEKLNIRHPLFREEKAKAQRRYVLYNIELKHVFDRLEQKRICCLPLKGIELMQLYPQPYLREMRDADILFYGDSDSVRSIMVQEGYTVKSYGKTNHDVYTKSGLFNVEMHRALFDGSVYPELDRYFSGITYRPCSENAFCLKMSQEEMYLHLIAHAYIHDSMEGTGLRTLLDLCLYLQAYGDRMDPTILKQELLNAGLTDYEMRISSLSRKLLSYPTMSPQERQQLDAYILAGQYGNESRFIQNRMDRIMNGMEKPSKRKYIVKRLSYDRKNIESSPFYTKHPKLAPLMYVTRPVQAVFKRPRSVVNEIKQIIRKQK